MSEESSNSICKADSTRGYYQMKGILGESRLSKFPYSELSGFNIHNGVHEFSGGGFSTKHCHAPCQHEAFPHVSALGNSSARRHT